MTARLDHVPTILNADAAMPEMVVYGVVHEAVIERVVDVPKRIIVLPAGLQCFKMDEVTSDKVL